MESLVLYCNDLTTKYFKSRRLHRRRVRVKNQNLLHQSSVLFYLKLHKKKKKIGTS